LRGPLGWLAAGHALLLLGALGYAWATMSGYFHPGHPLDVVFQLPLLPFAMAAVASRSLPPPIVEQDPGNAFGDVLTNLPAAAAIVIGAVRYSVGALDDSVTVVAALTILALLLARQFLAVRDVRLLTRTLEARVAERSRALETSELALIQAQRTEAIGRLARGIAHDFNNVLTAISGHVALLREDLGASHPARDSVDAVQDAVRCGADLARRLLTFSKPAEASPRLVPVRDGLNRAAQLARGLGRGRVQVEVVLGDPDACVYIDPVLLDQVLTNITANAVDAMPNGGLLTMEATTHRVTTPRNGSAPGTYVRFTLSDTGIGMDPATQSRIFEPFFTTKAEGRGTGLGLPTCNAIVTQAGGRIGVTSRLNEGSCFEILLPAGKGRDEANGSRPITLLSAGRTYSGWGSR
jgi:signal transduction histidine kinase